MPCAGPQRFDEVLLACECDARGRLGLEDVAYPPRDRLRGCAEDRAGGRRERDRRRPRRAQTCTGPAVGDAIRHARVQALEAMLDPNA